jgi:hypothetical protein
MEVVMKNLLFALVILGSLVSCGKNNVAGAPAVTGLTNPLTAATPIESDFITKVNANQFGTGPYSAYQSFAQALYQGANPTYTYAAYTAAAVAATAPNCHTAWIFNVCSSSTSSSSYQTPTVARVLANAAVGVVAQQNIIIGIYNRKAQIFTDGSGMYKVITTDNKTYFFDTKLPIQANPTQTYNADGTGEYLYKWL